MKSQIEKMNRFGSKLISKTETCMRQWMWQFRLASGMWVKCGTQIGM